LEDFWASLWDYFHIQAVQSYSTVLVERTMPGAQWFLGAELNDAEHVFRNATPSRPAVLFQSERHPLTELSWEELRHQVGQVAHALRSMGVQRGDRVVSYMGNIPETLIAFLATASLGAVWPSCSPDFGTSSVIDRFKQIEPKVLLLRHMMIERNVDEYDESYRCRTEWFAGSLAHSTDTPPRT